MQTNIDWKKAMPYVVAILLFILIGSAFLYPVWQGKKMRQGDITIFRGMSKELVDYREQTGEEALWTNGMFGGMPAYQISTKYPNNWVKKIDKVLRLNLPHPLSLMFLYFLGFFIFMLALGVGVWTSIIGAIAFAFSSYFIIIFEAGHNSKAHAIAYMAPLLGAVILTYKGKYVWGGVLTLLFAALEIATNHFQITYYTLIALLVMAIFFFIDDLKQKQLPRFLKASAVLVLAGVLAVLPNITNLMVSSEYGAYSTRGQSELAKASHIQTTGLDKDYVTQWSYGIAETWSLLVPNIKGGASGLLAADKEAMKAVPRQMQQAMAQMRVSSYWGDQPFTAGPTYAGAVVFFLCLLALVFAKGKLKWGFLSIGIVGVLLAWGKNFMPLTNLFLDYFPLYNKFRSVSMILVLAELAIPALAFGGLWQIINNPQIVNKKRLLIVWGSLQTLLLLFLLMPKLFFSFVSAYESQMLLENSNAQLQSFFDTVKEVRIGIYKADVLRSSLFVLLAGGLLYAFVAQKIKKPLFLSLIGVLVLVDMYGVARRYVDADNFDRAQKIERPYVASVADNSILQDKSIDYRVLNLNNPFNDGATSYFHKSVGGYHAAKMSRYQELIDHGLQAEISTLISALQSSQGDMAVINQGLDKSTLLNMLNTRYLIYNPSAAALPNPYAFGNAWFVKEVKWVNSAQAEMDALLQVEGKSTAIISQAFKTQSANNKLGLDSNRYVSLLSYQPNALEYQYQSTEDGVLVFSEIYYDKGWQAYLDGKPVPHMRANYVLRALAVPAGAHTIRFAFEPKTYYTGEKIALFGSILLIVLLVGAMAYQWCTVNAGRVPKSAEKA